MMNKNKDYRKLKDEFTQEEIEWIVRSLRKLGTLSVVENMWMMDGTPIIDAPEVEPLAELMKRIEEEFGEDED